MEEWETLEYKTINNEYPLLEWLKTLPAKKAAKVLEDIERFERYGPRHKPGFCEKITKNLSYIRTKQGSDVFRTFWFHWYGRTAVLTHGYQKKQNKADEREIRRGEAYRKDWLQRFGTGKE
ncbi:type II toxin-antitoxin system RelE/ParE family toxin [Lentibacillus kimchii]|uniref:Type II toxin-antitoxin system RelE/ParE family toxin n=2 Tax=Lentibacillus kimchii TaxID=1542911 RepID=A0ABW2UVN7_9BACI